MAVVGALFALLICLCYGLGGRQAGSLTNGETIYIEAGATLQNQNQGYFVYTAKHENFPRRVTFTVTPADRHTRATGATCNKPTIGGSGILAGAYPCTPYDPATLGVVACTATVDYCLGWGGVEHFLLVTSPGTFSVGVTDDAYPVTDVVANAAEVTGTESCTERQLFSFNVDTADNFYYIRIRPTGTPLSSLPAGVRLFRKPADEESVYCDDSATGLVTFQTHGIYLYAFFSPDCIFIADTYYVEIDINSDCLNLNTYAISFYKGQPAVTNIASVSSLTNFAIPDNGIAFFSWTPNPTKPTTISFTSQGVALPGFLGDSASLWHNVDDDTPRRTPYIIGCGTSLARNAVINAGGTSSITYKTCDSTPAPTFHFGIVPRSWTFTGSTYNLATITSTELDTSSIAYTLGTNISVSGQNSFYTISGTEDVSDDEVLYLQVQTTTAQQTFFFTRGVGPAVSNVCHPSQTFVCGAPIVGLFRYCFFGVKVCNIRGSGIISVGVGSAIPNILPYTFSINRRSSITLPENSVVTGSLVGIDVVRHLVSRNRGSTALENVFETITVTSTAPANALISNVFADCLNANSGASCSPSPTQVCTFPLGCTTFSKGINQNVVEDLYVDVRGVSSIDTTGYSFTVQSNSYGPESIYTTYLRYDPSDDSDAVTHHSRDILLKANEFFYINVENPEGEEGFGISLTKIATLGTALIPKSASFSYAIVAENECVFLAPRTTYTCNADPCQEVNFTYTRDVSLARISDSNYTVILFNNQDEDLPLTVSLTIGERACRGIQNTVSFCKNTNIRGYETIGFARYNFATEAAISAADVNAKARYDFFAPYFHNDDEHCADVIKEVVCEDNFRMCNSKGVHSQYYVNCDRLIDACGNQSCFRVLCKDAFPRAYNSAPIQVVSLFSLIISLALYFY